MSIKIDKATIEFIAGPVPYHGKPMNPSEGALPEQTGTVQRFRVTTLDTLNMVFGIISWPDARPEVCSIEMLDGLHKYQRLEKAGRLSFVPLSDGDWVGELNVLKSGNKGYPTLHASSVEELNALAQTDVTKLLASLGAKGVGTREVLHRETNKQKNRLAIRVAPNAYEAIAAAFTITRVLAIMNDLGDDAQ